MLVATPVATATWTGTHEEIFREAREYCGEQSGGAPSFLEWVEEISGANRFRRAQAMTPGLFEEKWKIGGSRS